MGFHWTLTAGFLYGLMAIIFFLCLPFISPSFWTKIFRSSIIQRFTAFAGFFFNMFVGLLVLVVCEAIRDTYTRNDAYQELKRKPERAHPDTETLLLMRLFRAQRNLHIGIFALFSWFVFRMLVKLITQNAQIKASQEASLKQAKNATEVAEKLLTDSKGDDKLNKKIKELEEELKEARLQCVKAEKDVEAMRNQSKQLTKEYQRITDENQALEAKLRVSKGLDAADKKKD